MLRKTLLVPGSQRQHVRRHPRADTTADRRSGNAEERANYRADHASKRSPRRQGDRAGTWDPARLSRNDDLADVSVRPLDVMGRPEGLLLFRGLEVRQRLALGPHRAGNGGI